MRNLIDLMEKLRQVSPRAANLAVTATIRTTVPLAATMGIRVDSLTDTRSQLSMPRRRRVKNHLGDIYFGAEMTVMELTMASLLIKRFPLGTYGVLVKGVQADFRGRAKTGIRAVCEPPPELLGGLEAQLREKGSKAEVWMPVQLLIEDDTVISEARYLVSIKKF
jgi:acyl-coenzyme A thioesterase PaaI-like protein